MAITAQTGAPRVFDDLRPQAEQSRRPPRYLQTLGDARCWANMWRAGIEDVGGFSGALKGESFGWMLEDRDAQNIHSCFFFEGGKGLEAILLELRFMLLAFRFWLCVFL